MLAKYQKSNWWGRGKLTSLQTAAREGGPEKKERTEKEEPRAGWLATTYQKVLRRGNTYNLVAGWW
jgi:hypothetical protein